MATTEEAPADIRLVLADVDGTLVTPDKELTSRSRAAVRRLVESGIAFTITSGRPPRGMKMLVDDLQLQNPIAAFNGGLIVRADLSVIREHLIPNQVLQPVIDTLTHHKLDVWIYTGTDWFVPARHGPRVDQEERTVKFPPTVVPSFEGLLNRVAKVVGVSDDLEAVARCEKDVRQDFGEHVSAARSQPYYLDVTHPKANKGEVIAVLSEMLQIPIASIATIGDMPSDVFMFKRSGVSIAMGNASSDVQGAAKFVTSSNQEEGFALAMERYVLRSQVA